MEVPSPAVEFRGGPRGRAVVALAGPLDVRTAARIGKELRARLSSASVSSLEIDATGVERGDMAGMVVLYELAQGRFTPGVRARLIGLRPELQKILDTFCSEDPAPPEAASRASLAEGVGAATVGALREVRGLVTFIGGVVEAACAAIRRPRLMRWSEVSRILESAGVQALPIVSLISLLTGLIIAFEAAQPLAVYGAQIYLANTIGRVMIRELGPIMTAVVLAGRSGSAFAAELGTMKIDEELDALQTMGLDPVRFLVIQRIFACMVMTPLLTVYAMAVGVLGGVIVMVAIGFSPAIIWTQLVSAVGALDVLFGIFKGFVFGVIVAGIGCLRGMQTKEGPSAVGDSTTRAVVAGILTIVVTDSAFSVLAYLLRV